MEEWRTEVPADCLFFDQLGARPWIRDFNRASPSPLAYYDGWLAVMAPYSDRCLMVEDGWDRLARDFTGFHGSMLMMAREHDLPDKMFGEGNWEPYPLATWLFHDKVLLYQHDLYDGTMAADGEVLDVEHGLRPDQLVQLERPDSTHSRARGSTSWETLQRVPRPALRGCTPDGLPGRRAQRDREHVRRSRRPCELGFGSRRTRPAGYGISPSGFLARTRDDRLLAGAFEDTFDGRCAVPRALTT